MTGADETPDKILIKAQRHPKRYESHKYWGRKPANIVRQYIECYSEPGDLVLDPFCGSGVTIFEALASGRNAVGYDLNPVACFITENLVARDVDLAALESCGQAVVEKVERDFPYYDVRCACGRTGKLINGVWRDEEYAAIYYGCPQCGDKMAEPTAFDKRQAERAAIPAGLWYPQDRLPEDADADRVDELFTKRNLLALSSLYQEINCIPDPAIRSLLRYTFTANVAFAARIIPVNEKRFKQGRNCTGVWGFKRFWLPGAHVENNVFRYFKNRLGRTLAAKQETNQLLQNSRARPTIINHSSTQMPELASGAVDFIFTDPPFGDMVPYLNLSTLWNAWLRLEANRDDEIIIDRQRRDSNYAHKLAAVFKESHRTLKDNGRLVVTFNNKSMKVWRILLEAIHNAGFSLQACRPAEDGEVSFTQTTRSARGSLRGHFVYIFTKAKTQKPAQEITLAGAVAGIEAALLDYIDGTGKSVTEIYNYIIPFMVNNDLLYPRLADNIIEKILLKEARLITKYQHRLIEGEMVELKSFYWVKK